jgi:two-component system, chemotaxis family, sensor kinase CheA
VSRSSDERNSELLELFFESAQDLLQSLNDAALKLEKHPGDGETVRSIRRTVHTLKGDAAAAGLSDLSQLAHELEDALALEASEAQAGVAEAALTAADVFGAILTCHRKGGKSPATEHLRKMVRELAQASKGQESAKKKSPANFGAAPWTEYEKLAIRNAFAQGKQVYVVRAQIDSKCGMPIAARQLLLKAAADLGEVLASRPEASASETSREIQLLVGTVKPRAAITSKCQIPTIISAVKISAMKAVRRAPRRAKQEGTKLAAGDRPQAKASAPALEVSAGETSRSNPEAEKPIPSTAPTENILRVDAARIDNVLNLVGELIIGKSMLQQAMNEFGRLYPRHVLRGRFGDAMAFQSRVLNDLQRAVMKVRMVPVEQLFRRFPRMVRDVAKQCGRDVELLMSGQDTDLDKGLLDAIAEPLTHLVRNAIGHGIESPEDRQRNGKPPRGILRLNAYHQANQVVVEVSDDGRGIDAQKVKSRALERGLLTSEEAVRASEIDVLNLIFRPGFSTADEITEIAGRGVGLDVVQSVLNRLKGSVNVETLPGQGTTFRLRLPLTLAIIKALLFRVEQRLYAIPLNAVAEIARARESDLHQVDNREVLQLRNTVLPIIRLGHRPEESLDQRSTRIFVLVISVGDRKFGLAVNSLEGEEELVIKALDDQTVETDLVSGASILGDGRVILILNLVAVIDRFVKMRPTGTALAPGLMLSNVGNAEFAQNAGGQP